MFLKAYEDYADAIFRHCFFRLRQNRELAKDMTQETFVKTWQYIARGNHIDNIRAFLYRTATNLIIDYARKQKPLSLDELRDEGFEPSYEEEETIALMIDAEQAKKLIDELDEPYRAAIVMRFLDELSPKEIASITGQTPNAVSVRINRALKKVRALADRNRSNIYEQKPI